MSVEVFDVAILKIRRKNHGVVVCLTKEYDSDKFLHLYVSPSDMIDYFIEGYYGVQHYEDLKPHLINTEFINYELIRRDKVVKLFTIVRTPVFLKTSEFSKFLNKHSFLTIMF